MGFIFLRAKSKRFSLIFLVMIITIFSILINSLLLEFIYPLKFKEEVFSYSKEYEIEEELVFAIIKAESNFNTDRISKAGACGLMQIMPTTASYICQKTVSEDDLFEPSFNISVGTKYLNYLFRKFKDVQTVICAYNAGEGNVSKWLNDKNYSQDGIRILTTPFRQTNAYLDKVLINMRVYKNKVDRIK